MIFEDLPIFRVVFSAVAYKLIGQYNLMCASLLSQVQIF